MSARAVSLPTRATPRSSAVQTHMALTCPNRVLCTAGEPVRRARQLYRWLYGRGKWIRSLDQADGDPQAFSAAFKAKVRRRRGVTVAQQSGERKQSACVEQIGGTGELRQSAADSGVPQGILVGMAQGLPLGGCGGCGGAAVGCYTVWAPWPWVYSGQYTAVQSCVEALNKKWYR